MIPQYQFIPVRGKIVVAVFDESGKRGGIGHRTRTHVLFKELYSASLYLIYLVNAAADQIVFPFLASACIDDDPDIVGELC